MGLQLLMSVVWDRSEMIFLRAYSGLDQIAFYSISAGLADKILLIPRTFGAATGITLMVESGRDATRVDSIVKNASRYLLLVVFPVHLGAAAIATGALAFAYGPKYAAAAPVMMIASILGMARAFQEAPDTLMRAADRQKQLLIALTLVGVLNMGLDWVLIPRYGAIGAAWGNGLSQAIGVVAMWQLARQAYVFSFPWMDALRLFLAGSVMAVVAYFIDLKVHGLTGVILSIVTAIPTYLILVKVFHGLHAADRLRLEPIGNRLPSPVRRIYQATIAFVTPSMG
jgi:O-antigen/teichoic acid export membrane protein